MEDLQSVLSRNNFKFKKQFGQNFISDTNLLASIVALAGVDKSSTVVEIGPGAGTLTREISKQAGKVVAFEIDRSLKDVLSETLRGVENTEVRFQDFEKVDLGALEEELGEYTVIANLPYYITTPLIARFLDEGKRIKSLVVMVQEEVADRLCAKEDTPEYGSITASIAVVAEAKVVKRVNRNMFYPRPNVDSAVVKIDFIPNRIPVKSRKAYRDSVRCAFLNRRKTLENNVVNYFKVDRPTAQEILKKADVPDKARGETLSPVALAKFSDVVYEEILNKQ